MSDTVIQVASLWKKYRLGVLGTGTLRHDFNRWLHRICGKPDPYAKVGETTRPRDSKTTGQQVPSPVVRGPVVSSPSPSLRDDEIWALRDISFEVKQGEILGIIGRNGAGKSTLLKILSRVTAPTAGEVRVKGRIASLLEVGTGFHPELTGRENIFLNGAILGMTKAEVRKRLDEIVAFAEVEKFLDTPVKRYSSGMYVRLAFAVAAHLEPEVLLVDEVLAVGDMAFQEKCFGRMENVAKSGRTVLVVSHNMGAIRRMAKRAVLLDQGGINADGPVQQAIEGYLGLAKASSHIDLRDFPDRGGNGQARILALSVHADNGSLTEFAEPGRPFLARFLVDFKEMTQDPLFQLLVESADGEPLMDLRSSQWGFRAGDVKGIISVEMRLESLPLVPGRYVLSPCVMDRSETYDLDYARKAALLTVADASPFPTGTNVDTRACRFVAKTTWRKAPA